MLGTTESTLRQRSTKLMLVAALVFAVPSSCTLSNEEDEKDELTTATSASSTGSCGVERWNVKTGTDSGASSVNTTPQSTTIASLDALPVPSGLGQNAGRLQPSEFQTFKLTNVTLSQYKLESDSDYHLVLTDGANTMIVEIPDPLCVGSGSPFTTQIRAARAAFDARFNATTSFQTANIAVTVTGVGFFDLLHGQTGVAPNGFELHALLSICFGTNCSGGATPDFSLGASPSSVSAAQGASATSVISASALNGFSGSISLFTSGVPAGASAGLSATSISASGSATLTLSAGTAAPGSYTVSVTGTSGTLSHSTSVGFTVTSGGGGGGGGTLTNGDFETGSLSGWTVAGTASAVTGGHGGTYAARVGSTAATNGDSSIAQSFTAPAGATSLSLYYKVVCPDSITYDWATATLADTTAGTTATVLAKTCTNSSAWVQASSALVAGHAYTLTLFSHDDNYAGDPTYTLYDDVTITTGGGGGGGITNGGFETGTFSGWTTSGAASSITTIAHSGTSAAFLGSSAATNGDSSIAQTFTVPAGKTQLSVWYANKCPDSVTYDWATITLKDNTSGTTTTVLPKTCTATSVWTNVTAAVTAGHGYTLTLTNHDDNYSGDPTNTIFDDVTLN